jgi:predicted 3-demethylubiquinone-9 3-methyltransferase (glyoxalase superfamily)
MSNRITACPWFDHEAGEAAKIHRSVFGHPRIVECVRWIDIAQARQACEQD